MDDHAARTPGRDVVGDRRKAVAAATSLADLVGAHEGVAHFMSTPYGAALAAHRRELLGRDEAEVAAELAALR